MRRAPAHRPLTDFFAALTLLGLSSLLADTRGQEVTLDGVLMQGGVLYGRVPPASRVSVDGRALRVSAHGDFVIGFGRDEKPGVQLRIHHPDGRTEQRTLKIRQRDYSIQRIDGLPQRQVTPGAADLKRIRREAELIKAAKRRNGANTDFLSGFAWPLEGTITGVFGSQRILNGTPKRPHYGVDVAASEGTPVKAPAAGVVSLVHADMYFTGGTVMIDHGHGLSSIFSHLSRVHVELGQRVVRGEVVAEVGATGRATGPHLHWGVNWFDRRLDPELLVEGTRTASD